MSAEEVRDLVAMTGEARALLPAGELVTSARLADVLRQRAARAAALRHPRAAGVTTPPSAATARLGSEGGESDSGSLSAHIPSGLDTPADPGTPGVASGDLPAGDAQWRRDNPWWSAVGAEQQARRDLRQPPAASASVPAAPAVVPGSRPVAQEFVDPPEGPSDSAAGADQALLYLTGNPANHLTVSQQGDVLMTLLADGADPVHPQVALMLLKAADDTELNVLLRDRVEARSALISAIPSGHERRGELNELVATRFGGDWTGFEAGTAEATGQQAACSPPGISTRTSRDSELARRSARTR